jgi:hypothetical protein
MKKLLFILLLITGVHAAEFPRQEGNNQGTSLVVNVRIPSEALSYEDLTEEQKRVTAVVIATAFEQLMASIVATMVFVR